MKLRVNKNPKTTAVKARLGDNMKTQKGWVASDLEDTTKWIYHLSTAEINELDSVLKLTRKNGETFETLTKERFPLPTLKGTFDRVLRELEEGMGFFCLRGLPAEKYSKEDLRLMYWGIGLNLGTAVTQSNRGDMLGDVRDHGVQLKSKKGRGYMTNAHLPFHSDSADVVCLMVLRVAKLGGVSRFVSSLAVHNEIKQTRPDLLKVLYQPFNWSWKGQEAHGQPPTYLQPMYSEKDGFFSSRFISQHVVGYGTGTESMPGIPDPTPEQREAIDLVVKLTEDSKFFGEMMFEPGDMQFMNNHVMYHSRTSFEDFEEPDRRRHLIRMWLSVHNSRPLSDLMHVIYQDPRPGAVRGGFPAHDAPRVFETPAITD